MIRRLPLIAAIGAVLLLTACGPASPTAPTASGTAAPSATPTPAPPTPTPTPSASDQPVTLTAGTCTAAEEAASGTEYAIPTVYTVYNTLASSPITIQYMAFNSDGTMPVQTITETGPVITIVGYPCTDSQGGAIWTLIASHNVPGSIGCVLDFGGLLVQTDSAGQEDPSATVTCSGNPGV